MGPILTFDKSFLESLNVDESVWLDAFFGTNITPLFFIETLADLEKAVRGGRTPEAVVGNLALKSPDLNSRPNVHHRSLLQAELMGIAAVDMRFGRPIIGGGRRTELDGQRGVVFQQAPEEEALGRWQRGEFLDLERQQAKKWRQDLTLLSAEEQMALFGRLRGKERPQTLAEVKSRVDALIDTGDQEQMLTFGLSLIGVEEKARDQILDRWRALGRPAIRDFAPYFRFFYGVELFFYLGLSSGLISDRRTNKVDMAYLYYLPFCMVFTSNDKLHAAVVPLFLEGHQEFIWGPDLKRDLAELNRHFEALPEAVKERGLHHFAARPPIDGSSLVAAIWDRHMRSDWRDLTGEGGGTMSGSELVSKFLALEGAPSAAGPAERSDKLDYMAISRRVPMWKGRWRRFPPGTEVT